MMKRVVIFLCVAALCAFPSLGAEFEVSGLDDLLGQAEDYGVPADGDLEEGVSNLISDAASQLGTLLRSSLSTGLKLMARTAARVRRRFFLPSRRAGLRRFASVGR